MDSLSDRIILAEYSEELSNQDLITVTDAREAVKKLKEDFKSDLKELRKPKETEATEDFNWRVGRKMMAKKVLKKIDEIFGEKLTT